MGFVQMIVDQAASAQGKNFTPLMPQTVSCDILGNTGLEKGIWHRNRTLNQDPSLIKPGDIFLIKKSRLDWTHTGIITDIDGTTIETIEGNTNHEGSRNGIAAMKRTRNFKKSNIDVFSIEPLVWFKKREGGIRFRESELCEIHDQKKSETVKRINKN